MEQVKPLGVYQSSSERVALTIEILTVRSWRVLTLPAAGYVGTACSQMIAKTGRIFGYQARH